MTTIELIDVLLENINKKTDNLEKGITTGFDEIDGNVGKLAHGQLMTIGGYTGTGKSFFIFNMIEGMIRDRKLKIAVFSTELSSLDYLIRYACMKAGIYKIQLQKYPDTYKKKVNQALIDLAEQNKENPIDIYGDIYSFEDIEKVLNEKKYDVVFIDYVQELTIKGKYDVKDTMAILGKELKKLALSKKSLIVAVSQVNNYAVSNGFDSSKTQLQPFTFGKELIQASSVVLLLEREKEAGILHKVLQVKITKARDGELGISLYKIKDGYNLSALDEAVARKYFNDYVK